MALTPETDPHAGAFAEPWHAPTDLTDLTDVTDVTVDHAPLRAVAWT